MSVCNCNEWIKLHNRVGLCNAEGENHYVFTVSFEGNWYVAWALVSNVTITSGKWFMHSQNLPAYGYSLWEILNSWGKKWETSSGKIVSLINLKTDF